jgi:quercetin dioxygenase-like cupin family protein
MKTSEQKSEKSQAQVLMPSQVLNEDISFLTNLGFRLHNIFPAEDPSVAIMFGHGLHLRIDKNADCSPPTLHLLTDEPKKYSISSEVLIAPNGTIIKIFPKTYRLITPPTQHKFEVRQLKDKEPWVIGRAGMLYRDLIPDRLGGSIIASHIRIPDGGPVPDMVHYHTIGFQLIFCYKGWVKLVYEDQGPPFILRAGDCVTQPPEIRHRVLESSDNLEVIEIGVPAEHMTTIDHDMELPTLVFNPDRIFQGQLFCHHKLKEASWQPWRIPGFEYRETGINIATNGAAAVQIARSLGINSAVNWNSHDYDILFTFVMQGKISLKTEKNPLQELKAGDAFVIPPFLKYQISDFSKDLELLEISLPSKLNPIPYE